MIHLGFEEGVIFTLGMALFLYFLNWLIDKAIEYHHSLEVRLICLERHCQRLETRLRLISHEIADDDEAAES